MVSNPLHNTCNVCWFYLCRLVSVFGEINHFFLSFLSVPGLSCVINQKMNWVELQFGRNKSLPSVCVQYEKNGICQVSVEYQCLILGAVTVIHLCFLLLFVCFFVFAEVKKVFR